MRKGRIGSAALLALAIGCACTTQAGGTTPVSTDTPHSNTDASAAACPPALDFRVKTIDGKDVDMCSYKGDVVLVVNVASKCGYTPQYEGLEQLYEKYKDKGFKVLGFPANDFGAQEPGTETEIKQFCTANYGVKFDMFSKITVVDGEAQAPLYKFLTSGGGDAKLAGPVKWNFQKYLIDRSGKLVAVFPSKVEPLSPEVTAAVEAALG